ncbi:hypothetical protein KIM372_07860 [Bombiscardovia nodaiensis]|uniref:Organic solvents resistance ABC transporter permease n=1 Tax=Bombiscardovia nodaiensis TaxID=2932181 RepID=A0ABM8B7Q3_9BIFI|nr:hypothetical protein KIM372_07860 [Bombiscardovia nodaiensis]
MVTGVLTAVLIVALAAALLVCKPSDALVNQGRVADAGERTVSQLNLRTYCPARMALSDTTGYGEAKPSEGNIASAAQYTAFGPVFRSSVQAVSGKQEQQLTDQDGSDSYQLQVASGSADQSASLQATHLLQAVQGAGAAASVVSWASTGDLRGVQASSCLSPAVENSFLLPSTQRGWSQQLVVYNPASKATSLNLQAWGSKGTGRLALATSGRVTVQAESETVVDIAAAAPDQDGLFLTLTGSEVPVVALIRASDMSGTTPKGSDFILDAPAAQQESYLPGFTAADQARLLLLSQRQTRVKASWVTATGIHQAQETDLKAGQVTSVDLGKAPDGAVGLSLSADEPVYAAAQLSRQGEDEQEDFAWAQPVSPVATSAAALPHQAQGHLSMINTGGDQLTAHLQVYDAAGKHLSDEQVELDAHGAQDVELQELVPDGAIVRVEDDSKQLAWAMRVGVGDVRRADLAGLAVLAPTSLMPQTMKVQAQEDQGLVR